MADREESIHVKIHLELSEEDEAQLKSISGQIAETDSAKPPKEAKRDKDIDEAVDKVDIFSAGNVGKFQKFTTAQFSNVKMAATNPFMFFVRSITGKLLKAGIAVGVALLLYEIVMFIINEAMKAGRFLDRRFRRVAAEEVLGFINRKEQQELRQGFKDIRVTTIQGLRGGMGQVTGNLFQHSSVYGTLAGARTGMRAIEEVTTSYSGRGFATTPDGNPRGGHRGSSVFRG